MSAELQKKHELDVFRRFADLAGIAVDDDSTMPRSPPFPDIVCTIGGREYGFELTTLTDENIERQFGIGSFHYTNYRIDIANAVKCIERKARKHYAMSELDLVIHEGGTPVDDLWLWDQQKLDSALQKAVACTQFRRVWLVDFSSRVVRCYNSSAMDPK